MKKTIMIIVLVLVIGCSVGTYCIHQNYELGYAMYQDAASLEVRCLEFAQGIAYMQDALAEADYDIDDVYTIPFDNMVLQLNAGFGPTYLPVSDNVFREYYEWAQYFVEIGHYNIQIEGAFADEQKSKEIDNLKECLFSMADHMSKFRTHYNELSDWERSFTSWYDIQEEISEKVRLVQIDGQFIPAEE